MAGQNKTTEAQTSKSSKSAEELEAEKKAAEQKAAEEKAAKEKKAAEEKAAAEQKAADEKKAAEEKAAKEKEAKRAKSRETPVLEKTKDNYEPEEGEEKHYHARIERKSFNQNTGERQSVPKVVKMEPKSWDNFVKNSAAQGYTVDILHDPTGKYPEVGVKATKKKSE